MADEISKTFKIGLSDDDKQQMKNEVVEIVGDITPKGQDTSTNILAFTENKGVYIATDNGAWYYWNELTSTYVYGGLYQESPRLIDLGNNFNEFKSTEENLSLICNKIASRDSGETVASNNYIYHAIVNGNDKVIALYAGNKNSMTFYLSTDSKDTTKYSYFKTYVGTYVEGTWKVERYVGASGGSGTTDFNALFNKPRINGVELVGNVSTDQLGIKIENAVTYKGSVATYIDLNNLETKAVGDMYNVNDTGRNYVWNGTTWDDMGELFDPNKLVHKLHIETTASTAIKEIMYFLIKNQYKGTYVINDLYIATVRKTESSDSYMVNILSLATSDRIILYKYSDTPSNVSIDTIEYSSIVLKEVNVEEDEAGNTTINGTPIATPAYVDTAIQNAITTALNSDY